MIVQRERMVLKVKNKVVEKTISLVNLKCKESVIIFGRNKNGFPDKCFEEGKEYIFCLDEKNGDIFTYNDVREVHFLSMNDDYTDKYFEVLEIKQIDEFNLDEFTLNRMKNFIKKDMISRNDLQYKRNHLREEIQWTSNSI